MRKWLAAFMLLSGLGPAPAFSTTISLIGQDSFDFGNVAIGQSVTVTNEMTNLWVNDNAHDTYEFAGSSFDVYEAAGSVTDLIFDAGTCNGDKSKATCNFSVTFMPTALGVYGGQATFYYPYFFDGEYDYTLEPLFTVNGSGIAAVPVPPAAILLASGLAFLVSRLRRPPSRTAESV